MSSYDNDPAYTPGRRWVPIITEDPTSKLESVDDLPKTLTGKIRRSELRKQEGL